MDDTKINDVPYLVHEGAMVRLERMNRRLWISTIILVVVLFITNGLWFYYDSQFSDTSVSQEVDTGYGDATVIGVGSNYGKGETDSTD